MCVVDVFQGDEKDIERLIVKKSFFAFSFPYKIYKSDLGITFSISWFYYFLGVSFPVSTIICLIFLFFSSDFFSGYSLLIWITSCFLSSLLFGFLLYAPFKPRTVFISQNGECRRGSNLLFQAGELENFYIVARIVSIGKGHGKLYDVQYRLTDGFMDHLYSSFSRDEVFSHMQEMMRYCNVGCIDCTKYSFDPGAGIVRRKSSDPVTGKETRTALLMIFGGLFLYILLLSVFRPCAFSVC